MKYPAFKWLLCLALALSLCISVLVFPTDASGKLTDGPTKAEIQQKWREVTSATSLYDQEPSVSAPYAAGKLTGNFLESGITFLNYVRFVANLPAVQLNDTLNEDAQHGAVVLAANDELTHYPDPPSDMDDAFYERGYDATTSSNISARYGYDPLTCLQGAVSGCMADNGNNNLATVGHRRWLLNPTLLNVGFGYAEAESGWSYIVTKVFDRSGSSFDYDFISWPVEGNQPTNLFGTADPWSITLNPNKYKTPDISQVKITITRQSDGKTWSFNSSTGEPETNSKAYMTVNTGGYGVSNCIIFHPGSSNVDAYNGIFTVEVSGIYTSSGAATTLEYQVDFFDVEASCVEHNYKATVTAPTCTKDGYTTYTCSNCGDSYTGDTVSATGHSWGSWTETKAPACDASGEEKRTCSACSATETRAVDPLAHSYTSTVTAPTCTEDGYTTYTCACGHSYTGDTVAATGHSWGSWTETKAPTCDTEGEEKRTCSTCAASETRAVDSLDHSYTAVVTAPTCTEDGYTTYTCETCGHSYTGDTVEASGHSWDDGVVTREPTETETGIRTYTCETCGATDEETIPVLDHIHSYTSTVTAPTCTEAGFTTYTCDLCGDSYTADETDALGHEEVTDAAVAATCTEAGLTEGAHCAVCQEILTTQEEVPATGHSWDEGVITKEPTEKEPGTKTFTCEVCGETRAEELPVLNPAEPVITRISGPDRSATSLTAADALKDVLGAESFDTIIIASGTNFADALTGSYLAAKESSPILLYTKGYEDELADYVSSNLSKNGTIYILGGTSSVPTAMEDALADFRPLRLAGADRFETNLKILSEAGVSDEEILVCTAYQFADSLSASAVGLPILLVGDNLKPAQTEFLSSLNGENLTIIGGVNSVSEALKNSLSAYTNVSRIAGSSREETSVAVAKRYFSAPATVVLAYSRNFPDGLCGGPLAYALNAPLILTASGAESAAAAYVETLDLDSGLILGGTASLPDKCANTVFSIN
ncbi:MAG: cell wall-binding repeat-containing protein [Oscillospiraceae bacterium]|nr:cell wall-binding repeat-containing protein [Oscillospiraceae bacterium]